VDLVTNRIDLQELPDLFRQIQFQCCTRFLRCNGPRNRCSASEHAFFVRPLGIAPEDRAPAQIITAFVGLLTPVLAKDSKRLLPVARHPSAIGGDWAASNGHTSHVPQRDFWTGSFRLDESWHNR